LSAEQPFEAMQAQILAGKAPRQVRLAASRGALPLPRAALVHLYVVLRNDEDEEIRAAAAASLDGLDKAAILDVLGDEACAPEVLDHYAAQAIRDEQLAERIAFHARVPPSAMSRLAKDGSGKVLDLVLTNQERLLSQLALLDDLTSNPALRADQRGRIVELLARATTPKAGKGGSSELAESAEDDGDEAEEVARLLHIDVGELFEASEIIDGEEFEESEDPLIRTAYAKILVLNTAQKAILAMRGGREERRILIRDSNQVVALAVLRNGRITEDDIESFAKMRNVSSEVLRQIGQNRDWKKNYQVVLSLVNNPRTPPGISTNVVSRLQNNHLKTLIANRDAPELIRRMAKRLYEQRTERKQTFKKH
jgi:hypothetical protein